MAVLHVTKENFDKEVMQSDKPVFIDFWASWCGPCQMVAPVIDELAQEIDDVKIVKINVDEETELAQKYNVMSIPSMLLIKNGEVVNTTMGAQPKEDILAFIRS